MISGVKEELVTPEETSEDKRSADPLSFLNEAIAQTKEETPQQGIPPRQALLKKLEATRILPGIIPPMPETVVSLIQESKKVSLFTKGSISAVIGKAKGGKTGLLTMIAAVVLCSTVGENELMLYSDSQGSVLYFDTEQGSHYAAITATRIRSMACDTSKLSYYNLRGESLKERVEMIALALEVHKNTSLVIIDGLKDLVMDINNGEEATMIINRLMQLSEQHNCHITCVLHQNKGDFNARGHLGTELTNKSETVISVNKDNKNKDVSIVTGEYTRGVGFDDFAFIRRADGQPELIEHRTAEPSARKRTNPSDFDLATHRDRAIKVFSTKAEMGYNELQSEIITAFAGIGSNFKANKAREFITHWWKKEEIINHNGKQAKNAKYSIRVNS